MSELRSGESDTESIKSESNIPSTPIFDSASQSSLTSPDGSQPPELNSADSNAGYEIPTRLRTLHNLVIQVSFVSCIYLFMCV